MVNTDSIRHAKVVTFEKNSLKIFEFTQYAVNSQISMGNTSLAELGIFQRFFQFNYFFQITNLFAEIFKSDTF